MIKRWFYAFIAPFIAYLLLFPLFGRTITVQAQETALSNRVIRTVTISSRPITLSNRPILPLSLKLHNPTPIEANTIQLALDSTHTKLLIQAPSELQGASITVEFRAAPYPLNVSYSVGHLLPIFSPDSALAPLDSHAQRANEGMPRKPPLRIEGYADQTMGVGQEALGNPAGNVNLTIEGPLYRGINLQAHIADRALPFQPEGTSTNLSGVDQIYVKVYDTAWAIQAGDILMQEKRGHFIRYNSQNKGVAALWNGQYKGWDSINTQVAMGAAKGQFERTQVQPQEGIQGPYLLNGARNFAQIVILAGSERVYVDGKEMSRGITNDYTIDYNRGTVTFTPQCPIRGNSRIVVEYETAERLFTRFTTATALAAKNRKGWLIAARGYVEHDLPTTIARNFEGSDALQLLETLPATGQKQLAIPKEPTRNGMEEDGYLLVDTVVEGSEYAIFSYRSAGVEAKLYELPFSYVGAGKGDYLLAQGSENRTIYLWVKPINGIPQGDYAPGIALQAPSTQALVEASVEKSWEEKRSTVGLHAAFSSYNGNSLAKGSKENSVALNFYQSSRIARYGGDGLYLNSEGQWIFSGFRHFERFLPVEFYRGWGENEPIDAGGWGNAAVELLSNAKIGSASLRGEMLMLHAVNAGRVTATLNLKPGLWFLRANLQSLLSGGEGKKSSRGEGDLAIGRRLGKFTLSTLGNTQYKRAIDGPIDPTNPDYAHATGGLAVRFNDSTRVATELQLLYRADWDTLQNQLIPRQHALEGRLKAQVTLPQNGNINATLNAKKIAPLNPAWSNTLKQNLLAQIYAMQPFWRQRITLSIEQSLSSEALPKWQLHYLPVQMGMGTHEWRDLNSDGTPQLEEFLPAQHRDRASYILQMVPSLQMQRALAGNSAFSLRINPRPDGRSIDSTTRWWLRFDITLQAQHRAKRTDGHWGKLFDPTAGAGDSELPERGRDFALSVSLNQNAKPLSLTYILSLNDGKQELAQGAEHHSALLHLLTLSTPLVPGFGARIEGKRTENRQERPYAQLKQREVLEGWGAETALIWRGKNGQKHEIAATMRWLSAGKEDSNVRAQTYGYSGVVPFAKRWQTELKGEYGHVKNQEASFNALTYQALRGASAGHNFTFETSVRYKITESIEATLSYNFRKNGTANAVHSGFLQARATF